MNVKVEGLVKSYGETCVVNSVSLAVNSGELLTLLGPSGCGKTTVLRMIAGLEEPTSGHIEVGNKVFFSSVRKIQLAPHLRQVGMVFQSYALWPHKTVFENIAFPLEIQKKSKEQIQEGVKQVLDLVEMQALAKRYPHELSGGQQQRVALARALAQKPGLLLLDEPLSNLDAKLRTQMRKELKALQRQLGITMIYVTHDRLEALELSHRIAVMDQGYLIQLGDPTEVQTRPANQFVREFLAS